MRGSFTWELDYLWTVYKIPEHTDHLAYNASTLIGCGFAVQRSYFFNLGGFDEGLKVWGGENHEISFRTWQCGGSIKIVPCSVVGHVFRAYLPYFIPHAQIMKNLQRVAEVWMDKLQTILLSDSTKSTTSRFQNGRVFLRGKKST